MSANSVEKRELRIEVDEKLIAKGNKLYIKKHFLPKSNIDYNEIAYLLLLDKIACSKNCEIINAIEDKLTNHLGEDCRKKPLHKKIQQYKNCHKKESCSDTEIFKECCNLESNIETAEW